MGREIDFDADLDEMLVEETQPPQGRAAFTVDDLDKAAWASRKVALAERRKQEIEAWAQRRIDEIKALAEREITTLDNSSSWLRSQLEMFLANEIAGGHPKKSIGLPGGTIGFRSGRPKILIGDEAALIAYLKAADVTGPVKVVESIDKTALKAATEQAGTQLVLKATGEILEGVSVEPATENFYFKPTEEG